MYHVLLYEYKEIQSRLAVCPTKHLFQQFLNAIDTQLYFFTGLWCAPVAAPLAATTVLDIFIPHALYLERLEYCPPDALFAFHQVFDIRLHCL